MIFTRLISLHTGFARSWAVAGAAVAVALWGGPALGKTAPPGWPEAYGLYDWTEASRIIAVGTVAAVDDTALQVDVEEVLRGTVQCQRMTVSPSLVDSCLGPSPVLQAGERAVLFIKGVEEGRFALVYPGAVLNTRFAGLDAIPGIRGLLEITALPEQQRREHAVIDLLDSPNKVLRQAATQFISAHVVSSPDVERYAPQLIAKLSSPDPAVRAVATSGLRRARSAKVMTALVRTTRDANVGVVCAASQGLAKFDDEEAVKALLALFKHEDPDVRVRACLDIDTHVRPDVINALLGATRDPIAKVRAVAATGLIYSIREKEGLTAVPRLKEMLSDSDPEVRGRAARALGETRDPRLVALLLNRLGPSTLPEDEEWPLVSALGMLPHDDETVRVALREHVSRLGASLRQGHRVAITAASLLATAGTPEARTILEDAADNHPLLEVREAARVILGYWNAGEYGNAGSL